MLPASLVPGTHGTVSQGPPAALFSVGNIIYMELLQFSFPASSSSPAHPAPCSFPGSVPVPPASRSGFTHTLFPASAFCFPLGLHLKALLMSLGTNMKRFSLRLPAADGDLGSIHVLFSTGE